MISKYFPLPDIYEKVDFHIYDEKYKSDIYRAIRAILKDPAPVSLKANRSYSLCFESGWSNEERVRWTIYESKHGRDEEIQVTLPIEGSTNPTALLVQIGSHTIEETWAEYKDMWYEDVAQQLSHLAKGVGLEYPPSV